MDRESSDAAFAFGRSQSPTNSSSASEQSGSLQTLERFRASLDLYKPSLSEEESIMDRRARSGNLSGSKRNLSSSDLLMEEVQSRERKLSHTIVSLVGPAASTPAVSPGSQSVRKQNPVRMSVVEDYKGLSVEDQDEFYATSDSNEETFSDDEEGHTIAETLRPPQLRIDRAAMHQKAMHERFQYEPPKRKNLRSCLAMQAKNARKFECMTFMLGIFPILEWLPLYEWKRDFVSDLSAGVTVAVMHIPQGLAYALLASVPAVTGIYTAFFPVIIYIFMGTAKHVSVGSFAVISLLVSKSVHNFATLGSEEFTSKSQLEAGGHEGVQNYTAVEVMAAVTFMSGIFQVIFCILHLGALASLLSHPLIRGFTTGAAIHVFSSQVKTLLGIKVPRFVGPFNLFKMYYFICAHIQETNTVTLGISISVVTFLYVYSYAVEAKLMKILRGVNFPIQLLIVLVTILISWPLDLTNTQEVKVVGPVESGLPTPFFPPVKLLEKVAVDALIIAVVSFVSIYSLGSLFANKYQYKVSADQEFLAQGASNIFGSFFSCLPIAGSLSRTSVQEKAGCKTMMTSAVSVFLLLFVLLFAGSIFYHLPECVLSAIIIHALNGMFKQVSDLPPLYSKSFSDFFIWIVAFVATVCFEVDVGLLVAVAVNVVILVYWALYPKVIPLVETDFLDLAVNPKYFHDVREIGKYVILRLLGNINFSNAARMQETVESTVESLREDPDIKTKPSYVILDVSGVPQMDLSACVSLIALHKNLRLKRLRIAIVGASGILWRKFELCGVFDEIHRHRCFYTLQDALVILKNKEKRLN